MPEPHAGLKDDLVALLEPLVADHDAELVDLEVVGAINNQTVRLLVHRDPAIGLDQCEAISREAADLLDVEDPVPGRYRLEVTSPGLDRPLQTDQDFGRAAGRLLKVVMSSGRTLSGRLQHWEVEQIVLDDGDEALSIDRKEIAKATIQAEL